MDRKILIDGNYANEPRVALINKSGILEDFKYFTDKNPIQGNIYLAKVVKVEPALHAVFISYAKDKSGFLPFSEIHPDYYENKAGNSKVRIKFNPIILPEITNQDLLEHQAKEQAPAKDLENIESLELNNLDIIETEPAVDIEIEDTDIEILGEDKKNENILKARQIQEVIKKGQILLVQAQKEERGNKAAYFSTYISLSGKYSVLLPNTPKHNGVSRRIADIEERKRLKNLILQLLATDQATASMIIRTSGLNHTSYEIKRDYEYLVRLWNKILAAANSANTTPAFIHVEEDIVQKAIRDLFDHTVGEIVVQGAETYRKATEFMQNILHTEPNNVQEYTSKLPIFSHYNVEDQITQLYQPTAFLPSGGYVVINPTEALIAIDVNSGKSTSENNIEETALKTNLEAAKEIAKQLRLRDISGLIVIDFIDMHETKNRKIVERSFRNYLLADRAKMQIGNISNFGLLEMSRQRLRPSFLENHTVLCNYCSGKGLIRSERANSLVILHTIENELAGGKADTINVLAHQNAITHLFNHYRSEIVQIEQKHKVRLNLYCDPTATAESFILEKETTAKNKVASDQHSKPAIVKSEILAEEQRNIDSERQNKRRNKSEENNGSQRIQIAKKHPGRKFSARKHKNNENSKKTPKKRSFLKGIIDKIVS